MKQHFIKNTKICMKCLSELSTFEYEIKDRGYGSIFDGVDTKFQLCDTCHKDEYIEWVNEKPIYDGNYETYQNEKNIMNLIRSFQIKSQELFFNTFGDFNLPPQVWIDYQLNLLSDKRCKDFGLITVSEKKSYKSRFKRCNKVTIYVNPLFGYSYSSCINWVNGNKSGKCNNFCGTKCLDCKDYKSRKGNQKIVFEEVDKTTTLKSEINDFIVTDYFSHNQSVFIMIFGDKRLINFIKDIKLISNIKFNVFNLKNNKHLITIDTSNLNSLQITIIKGYLRRDYI